MDENLIKVIRGKPQKLKRPNLHKIAVMLKISKKSKITTIIDKICGFEPTAGIRKSFQKLEKYCATNDIDKGDATTQQELLQVIKNKDRKFSQWTWKPMCADKYYRFLLSKIAEQTKFDVPDTEESDDDDEDTGPAIFFNVPTMDKDKLKTASDIFQNIENGIKILQEGGVDNFHQKKRDLAEYVTNLLNADWDNCDLNQEGKQYLLSLAKKIEDI